MDGFRYNKPKFKSGDFVRLVTNGLIFKVYKAVPGWGRNETRYLLFVDVGKFKLINRGEGRLEYAEGF